MFVDPFPVDLPSSSDPASFDPRADAYYEHLPVFVDQLNDLPTTVASAAQAGGFALAFLFVTATAGDPGPGGFRLNNATQRNATGAGLDLVDSLGTDISGRVARVGKGTSVVKGELAVYAVGDGRRWLSFEVASATSPTGYRNLVLQNGVGSEASPFAAGDAVMVTWTPAGDMGSTGPTADLGPHLHLTEEGTAPSPNVGGRATRTLDTVNRNLYGWAFSSYAVTLPAGNYKASAWGAAIGVDKTALYLRNVTDGTDVLVGLEALATTVGEYGFFAYALIPDMPFTLTGTKTIRLEQSAQSSGYMGTASFGATLAKKAALAITKRD